MEQKSTIMFKSAMNSGLVLALVSILVSVIIWATALMEKLGLFATAGVGLFSLLITVIMLIILTKRYRDNSLNGVISFKDAFVFGVFVVVLSTIISALYSYIFNNFIDPGYQERILTSMQDKLYQFMSAKGVPEDQIEQTIDQMQAKGTPTPMEVLTQSVIFGIIGGTIMSLISSAIVKKKNEDAFDEAMDEIKSEE